MSSRRPLPFAAAAVVVLLVACGPAGAEQASIDPDTLSRRQKDSIISTLPIPGAGVVGRALDASDDAAARARRFDSLAAGR